MKSRIRRRKPSVNKNRWPRIDVSGVRRALRALLPEPVEVARQPARTPRP